MDQRLETISRQSKKLVSDVMTSEIDLAEILRIVWRRKLIIFATIFAITGLTFLYANTATPKYTAQLQLLFESKAGAVFDFNAAAEGKPQDEAAIISEMEVVRSRALIDRLIDKLGLDQDPEFNVELREPSKVSTFLKAHLPEGLLASLQEDEEVVTSEDLRQILSRQRVIDAVLEGLDTVKIPQTRTIDVRFTSVDPEKAAKILNALAELYVVAGLEDKFENAQRASTWLAGRVQKLRERVEQSERAVEDYRRRYGLFEGERVALVAEQVSGLSAKLTDATIERRAAEANLAQVRRLLTTADAIDTASQVLQSDLIRRFREEEIELDRKEAEYSQKYGARHPLMIQLQAERDRFRQKVRSEIAKIVRGLENELQVARAREAALSGDLQNVKSNMAQANQASVGLNTLEREAEANRLLLDKFMTAFMESSAQEDIDSQMPDARIISPAAIPEEPSFPKRMLLLVIAFFGASVFGVLIAFVVEHLDAGFRSAEQLEAATGLSVLAHVPQIGTSKTGGEDLSTYVLKRPDSAFAEAIRSIYTRLLLALQDQAPKVVLLVSSEADEGKSTISLSIARQQAQAGRRVVFVDTDFRRSRITYRIKGLAPSPGVSEVLKGLATLKEAKQSDPKSAADIIVAGEHPMEHFDILSAGKLEAMLRELRQEYDLIVVDAAPILALADAHVIASVADVTLMIVRWGKTRRRVARYAIQELTKYGGQVAGVVFSMVDVRRHAGYGFGDSGYYYGKSRKYYTAH
jgi:exopolysaccharide transport family protein